MLLDLVLIVVLFFLIAVFFILPAKTYSYYGSDDISPHERIEMTEFEIMQQIQKLQEKNHGVMPSPTPGATE